jgi:hypothetical protein
LDALEARVEGKMIQIKSRLAQWRLFARPIEWPDMDRVRQRSWWVILALFIATIVLTTLVRSWADCQYFYQAELDHYLAHPNDYVRPPQPPVMPTITKVIRIAGQLVDTMGAWIIWTGGLCLISLLLEQQGIRLSTFLPIVAWSWLPFVVRGLAQCMYMWLTQDPIFNPGLSGLVFDDTPPPPGGEIFYVTPTQGQQIWSTLLSSVDMYQCWHLALVVIGLRRSAGFTVRKAILVTTIVVVILALIALLPILLPRTLGRLRFF